MTIPARPPLADQRGALERLGRIEAGADEAEVGAAFDRWVAEAPVHLHKKGGIYLRRSEARSADDLRDLVVYEHVWPRDPGLWVRDKAEFDQPDRFLRLA